MHQWAEGSPRRQAADADGDKPGQEFAAELIQVALSSAKEANSDWDVGHAVYLTAA